MEEADCPAVSQGMVDSGNTDQAQSAEDLMERGRSSSIVGGIALGAAAMYLLDPRSGRRRRALARDRLVHYLNVAESALGRTIHDAGNRAQGTVAKTRRLLTPEEQVDDRRLEARVRSTLGRLASKPSSIRVEAEAGTVTLTGTVVESELGYILTGIRRVRGVRHLESRLEAGGRATTPLPRAPSAEGEKAPPALLQNQMSPTGRIVVGTVGFGILAGGIQRGGITGAVGALFGGLLIARAVTNTPSTLVSEEDPISGVSVESTLELAVPVREVFRFWSNLQNLPRFMRHLREVRENESGTSHWVAERARGGTVAWDAEIVALKPHQRLAWKSVTGAEVISAGDVQFEELDPATTRLRVQMTYPRGGSKPTPFGADPARQLEEDLERLRQLLEAQGRPGSNRVPASENTQMVSQ